MENTPSLTHSSDRPREVKNAFCSSQKVREEWNYNATITVDKTIDEMVSWIKPQVRDFEYHLPIEFTTEETPKTWTEKINSIRRRVALRTAQHQINNTSS